MQSLIISYPSGMFGEFTASLIEEGSDKFISNGTVKTTTENRFLYPNYLAPINFEGKTFPKHTPWPITDTQVDHLKSIYNDKWICIPTHWYSDDIGQCKLPCQGIVMYSTTPSIIKLSYSLFWIKSHVFANSAWPNRMQELQLMIDSNHQYAKELSELQVEGNYRNWKFLAYKFNFLKNGKLDLYHYISRHYHFYKKDIFTLCSASPSWFKFDIGNAIHGDRTNLSLLEDYLNISINRQRVVEYSEKNLAVLKDKLGFSLDDLSSDIWLDTLYDYCKLEITD
jgi:hypothetical protein